MSLGTKAAELPYMLRSTSSSILFIVTLLFVVSSTTLGAAQQLYAPLEEPASTAFSERVHLELSGGLLAGGAMVALGYLMLESDCSDAEDSGSCHFGRGLGALFSWTAGQAIAIPAGVTLGGSLGGGDGGFGWSAVGSGIGTAVGSALWYGLAQSLDSDVVIPVGHLILGSLALTGSLIGYELSTSPSRSDEPPAAPNGVHIEPMIAAVPNVETLSIDALTLGVQGTM